MSEHEPKEERSQEDLSRLATLELDTTESQISVLEGSIALIEEELEEDGSSVSSQQRAHEDILNALRIVMAVNAALLRVQEYQKQIKDSAVAQTIQIRSEELQTKLSTFGERLERIRNTLDS